MNEKKKSKSKSKTGIGRILGTIALLGLIGVLTIMPVTATRIMDESLKTLINSTAPEYYNSTWSISETQFEAWIAMITLSEGPANADGYVAQSTGSLRNDSFNHKDLGENFIFSTGIGPFQLDYGGEGGGVNWTNMTTLNKTDPEKSLRSVLRWHNVYFGSEWELSSPPTLFDFYTYSAWHGPSRLMGSGDFKPLWNNITDSDWDSVKNIYQNVSFHPLNGSYPYGNDVIKVGSTYWNILDGYYDTWLMKGEGPGYSGEFYYAYNDTLEIWVYNDTTKTMDLSENIPKPNYLKKMTVLQ